MLYIPIWFYSNVVKMSMLWSSIFLYIPIWFYSNSVKSIGIRSPRKSLHSNLVLFKFEYTNGFKKAMYLYIPIWFYSNDEYFTLGGSQYASLHSNLVLFKFNKRPLDVITVNTFTFQSGSIQIHMDITGRVPTILYIPPLCQVLDTYFFKFPIHFFTSILTSTLDFSIDY